MCSLVWFREDLRISDNPALYAASQTSTGGVAAIFLMTPSIWQYHHMAPIRMRFLQRGLADLSESLLKKNIALKVLTVNDMKKIPETLYNYAKQINASDLFFNNQYEVNELKRDEQVEHFFRIKDINVHRFDDQIIFTAETLHRDKGSAFKVFTPFKKNWIKTALKYGFDKPLPPPRKQAQMLDKPTSIKIDIECEISDDHWPAGEQAAQQRLTQFTKYKISDYANNRNFPALDGTSKLSPYLSAGMISGRQCMEAALAFNQERWDTGNQGAMTWLSELIWREFYKYILICFPRVSKNLPFKLTTTKLGWQYNKKHFIAWQQGMTGFPLVDAAMRQLNQTGWMHNRLRMLVAMFLSKTLFTDWRLGEQYFSEHLIDGDLAANNGGWQWSASTGVDAAPYFRIFNPYLQSERFDPDGKFIRQYCPELTALDNKQIHEPYKIDDLFSPKIDYPRPIVNHALAKEKVLQAFKALG